MRCLTYKQILLLILFTPIFLGLSIAYAEPSAEQWSNLINLSGKQRMLTQKMSKEALAVALNLNKQAMLEQLDKTQKLFDKTLMGLQQGDASLKLVAVDNKRINRQLSKVVELWKPFQTHVNNVLTAGRQGADIPGKDIEYIANNNLELLKQMNRAVRFYEKFSSRGESSVDAGLSLTINLSGKQRMLTQKMVKEFLLVKYGLDVENNKSQLINTIQLFSKTLVGLEKGDESLGLPGTQIAAANQQLKVVDELWQQFNPIMSAFAQGQEVSEEQVKFILDNNVKLLKEMNKAVGIYASNTK